MVTNALRVGDFVRISGVILLGHDPLRSPVGTLGRVIGYEGGLGWPYTVQFVTGETTVCEPTELLAVRIVSKAEIREWSLYKMRD